MTMQLAPVPTETATCANCSAPLVADQRYCLTCGQPVSPVRLAFLDVLQGEGQPAGRALATTPLAYAPLLEPTTGAAGWLRRYSPLFGALTVMLLAVIAGLLVGHWVTQRNAPVAAAPTPQTIKIEGLGGLASAAATTPSTSTSPGTATSKSAAKEESEEAANEEKTEAAQAKKAETAPVIKQSSGSVKKLNKTTGKKHEEEINSLGAQPIETG